MSIAVPDTDLELDVAFGSIPADAVCDGLCLTAIAGDVADDGDTALELVDPNDCDVAVLAPDIPRSVR